MRLLPSVMNRMGSLRESLDQQGHNGLSSQSGATTGLLLSLTPHASALTNLSRLISGPLMHRRLPEVSQSHVMCFSDTSSLHRLTRSGGGGAQPHRYRLKINECLSTAATVAGFPSQNWRNFDLFPLVGKI